MRHALAFAAALLVAPAAALADSGSEPRTVPAFTSASVSAGIQLIATAGATQTVEVRGEATDRADVVTEVSGGSLDVHWKSHMGISNHSKTTVVIAVPKLQSVSASGGANAELKGLAVEKLSASGGGSINAEGLSGKVKVDVSGGARATLAGNAESLKVEASGGAQVHAEKLAAQAVAISGSGGGQVEVQANGALSVEGSGGMRVRAHGHPTAVSKDLSGGASLELD